MGIKATEAKAPDYFADAPGYATHEVFNQAGALAEYDAYADDKPLLQAMKTFGADWADEVLHRAGRHVGSQNVQYLARQANRHLPELQRTLVDLPVMRNVIAGYRGLAAEPGPRKV